MLYIKQDSQGAHLVYENYTTHTNKASISILKLLCQSVLVTYEARILTTKKQFKIHTLTPLYINTKMLLIPTGSPRSYETIWINYLSIVSIQPYGKHTVVLFNNLTELEIPISYNRFKEKLKYCKIIYDYMEDAQTQII
ncbi:competence protein ComK [Paracholeplasma vituli]|uniref:competence protein ComK n=1 Tax=Paracholeplasma vituli TaxID=69473 RepID=UPI0021C93D76|nr:competence protein ComK [Paracholeplasma vituli]